jgi:hypothetical protein
VLLLKATELTILHLLKYEDSLLPHFEAAGMKPANTCANGVVLSKFNALSALLDRYRLLAELVLKGKSRLDNAPSVPNKESKEIDSLKAENQRLTVLLEEARARVALLEEERQESVAQPLTSPSIELDRDLKGKVPKDVLESVTQLLRQHFQASQAQLEQQFEQARQESNLLRSELQAYKTRSFEVTMPVVDPSKGRYEECLAGELAMMRDGYEKKLHTVQRHQEDMLKELSRREAQTKREITTLKQEQQLLLKKWELLKST